MTRRYRTPNAFEQALKSRVKRRARTSGRPFNRMLQIVVFERFLARVYAALGDAVILEGGFAMELRLSRARTTKDIDMRVEGNLDELVEDLREEAAKQEEDYLTFTLGEEADFEEMLGDQVVYGGRRIKIRAMLAGQPFGEPFRLDLSVADRLLLPADKVRGSDIFEFIGLEPLEHSVYPEEAHIAEKLHAYTMPRDGKPNSRMKDLVDIGLLAQHTNFDADDLFRSIVATFESRDTNPVPGELPDPPPGWTRRYGKMRERDELEWEDIDALFELCRAFLEPLLQRNVEGKMWAPAEEQWC